MNRAEMARELSKELRCSVQEAEVTIEAVVLVMGRCLARGEALKLSNFASIRPVKRRPRSFGMRSHARPVKPETVQVQFKAADRLLEAIRAGDDRVTFQKRPGALPGAS